MPTALRSRLVGSDAHTEDRPPASAALRHAVRSYSHKYGRQTKGHAWIKTHAAVGAKTNIVTAVSITGQHAHDAPQLPGLVEATAKNFDVEEVSADKAYSSKKIHALVDNLGATALIPFKYTSLPDRKSPAWSKAYHYFAMNRDEFLARYHRRSNVETAFSSMKRVFGDSVRSKTPVAQQNEVLLKVLCHNIRCLIHEMYEIGIEPSFVRT